MSQVMRSSCIPQHASSVCVCVYIYYVYICMSVYTHIYIYIALCVCVSLSLSRSLSLCMCGTLGCPLACIACSASKLVALKLGSHMPGAGARASEATTDFRPQPPSEINHGELGSESPDTKAVPGHFGTMSQQADRIPGEPQEDVVRDFY